MANRDANAKHDPDDDPKGTNRVKKAGTHRIDRDVRIRNQKRPP